MEQQSWQSVAVAVAFIALVGVALGLAVTHDFNAIWTGVGPLVGVLTGAIPSYFFHQQSQRADAERNKATAKAQAIAAAAPFEVMAKAQQLNPAAFAP